MKKNLLTFLALCLAINVFSHDNCPVFKIGEIHIVDESGKPILHAKIWRYYSIKDSFKLDRQRYFNQKDTTFFTITTAGGIRNIPEDHVAPDKHFFIEAEGYTPVVLKHICFQPSIDEKRDRTYAVVVITLYPQKAVKVGNKFVTYERFILGKTTVIDSMHIDLKDLIAVDDYAQLPQATENSAIAKIQAYPNPTLKEIQVLFNSDITEIHILKITDLTGRVVQELKIETSAPLTVNLEWEKPASYFLVLYDTRGELVHKEIIVKTE